MKQSTKENGWGKEGPKCWVKGWPYSAATICSFPSILCSIICLLQQVNIPILDWPKPFEDTPQGWIRGERNIIEPF